MNDKKMKRLLEIYTQESEATTAQVSRVRNRVHRSIREPLEVRDELRRVPDAHSDTVERVRRRFRARKRDRKRPWVWGLTTITAAVGIILLFFFRVGPPPEPSAPEAPPIAKRTAPEPPKQKAPREQKAPSPQLVAKKSPSSKSEPSPPKRRSKIEIADLSVTGRIKPDSADRVLLTGRVKRTLRKCYQKAGDRGAFEVIVLVDPFGNPGLVLSRAGPAMSNQPSTSIALAQKFERCVRDGMKLPDGFRFDMRRGVTAGTDQDESNEIRFTVRKKP